MDAEPGDAEPMNTVKRYARGSVLEVGRRVRHRLALAGVERRNPVLVYQMGKVGSSTVVDTLETLDLGAPVLHVHTLTASHLQHARARQRASAVPFLPDHLVISNLLQKKLARGPFACRLVTLTREPVARAVSFVFEDLKKQAPDARLPEGGLDVRAVEQALLRLLRGDNGIADPTQWFDDELKACFGIDVFSQPYDAAQGYGLFDDGDVPLLVLRLEDLNRSLPAALGALFGRDSASISVVRANVGAEKWYAEALAQLKQSFRLPPDVAGRVFSTRYFRHFYGADAEAVRRRWVAGGA